MYPPLAIKAWLSITQSEGASLNRCPNSAETFMLSPILILTGPAGRFHLLQLYYKSRVQVNGGGKDLAARCKTRRKGRLPDHAIVLHFERSDEKDAGDHHIKNTPDLKDKAPQTGVLCFYQ